MTNDEVRMTNQIRMINDDIETGRAGAMAVS